MSLRLEAARRLAMEGPPVFELGEVVEARDDWGVLVCDLSVRAREHPHAEYLVVGIRGGRWLVLLDENGRTYSGVGAGYFRIAGECRRHHPMWATNLICARCDAPLPEAVSRYWIYHRRAA